MNSSLLEMPGQVSSVGVPEEGKEGERQCKGAEEKERAGGQEAVSVYSMEAGVHLVQVVVGGAL